jgi:peroxin-7
MLYQSDQSAASVQFSPFSQGRIALATSQNFGIVGNGRVTVLQATQTGFDLVASYDTADGVLQEGTNFWTYESAVMLDW